MRTPSRRIAVFPMALAFACGGHPVSRAQMGSTSDDAGSSTLGASDGGPGSGSEGGNADSAESAADTAYDTSETDSSTDSGDDGASATAGSGSDGECGGNQECGSSQVCVGGACVEAGEAEYRVSLKSFGLSGCTEDPPEIGQAYYRFEAEAEGIAAASEWGFCDQGWTAAVPAPFDGTLANVSFKFFRDFDDALVATTCVGTSPLCTDVQLEDLHRGEVTDLLTPPLGGAHYIVTYSLDPVQP